MWTQADGTGAPNPPPYGSSTGVLRRKCCESLSFRDIYIFYEKKKKETHLEMLIEIQAFELLVFTRLQSKRTLQTAGLDPASTRTTGGTLVCLGAI